MEPIRFFSYSEPGDKPENEDALVTFCHPQNREIYVGAVADGQGGRAGGRQAAKLACQKFRECSSTVSGDRLLAPDVWEDILAKVDRAVADDSAAGFTTFVALAVGNGRLVGASNGDSAAVLLIADKPGLVLTSHQHKNPPVGSGAVAFVTFAAKLTPPWTILALTDGVWKYTGWEHILSLNPHTPPQQVCQSLLDRARLAKTGRLQDDFTLILLQEGGD
jgi:hypothetical protein